MILGCGHRLLPPWRLDEENYLVKQAQFVVGLDYDYDSLAQHRTINNRVRGDISVLPFNDEFFDLITANSVFEHLKEPEDQLKEILRILRPGGVLVFHTPNLLGYIAVIARVIPESVKARLIWFLQRREEVDVFRTCYRINTHRRILELAKSAGFDVEAIRLIVSGANLAAIPPLAVIELLLIQLLMTKSWRHFMTCFL